MTPQNEFDLWKQRRADETVPPGFADRVMAALPQREERRHLGWESLLTSLLLSRPGKVGVCTLGALACALRMIALAALFFAH